MLMPHLQPGGQGLCPHGTFVKDSEESCIPRMLSHLCDWKRAAKLQWNTFTHCFFNDRKPHCLSCNEVLIYNIHSILSLCVTQQILNIWVLGNFFCLIFSQNIQCFVKGKKKKKRCQHLHHWWESWEHGVTKCVLSSPCFLLLSS